MGSDVYNILVNDCPYFSKFHWKDFLRHIKKLLSLILLCSPTGVIGCDGGEQRGQYVVRSSGSRSLTGISGKLTIVRGDPTPVTLQSTGQLPLLYLLVVAPGVEAFGSGNSTSHGKYVSSWTWTWETNNDKVSIECSWDRRKSTVSAGGTTFDWKLGGAFVIVREPSGKVTLTQVGTIDAGLDEFAALQQIQSKLPQSSPAKTVKLIP